MKRATILLSLIVSVSAFAQATAPSGDKIIAVGDRAVHIREEGLDLPVVVFVAGMGDTLATWSRVTPDIAKFAHVFTYDRAGSGQSSPASTERSYAQLATELHQALEAQRLPAPYLLVGHSFGAIVVRAFAAAASFETTMHEWAARSNRERHRAVLRAAR